MSEQPGTALERFAVNGNAILQYLNLDPSDARTHAIVAVCQRYDLDPVLKHVVLIPQGGVYVTRDGLLHVAHKSGQFDGMEVSEPVMNEDKTHWVCKASVWRKDMSRPFTYSGRYPKDGGNKKYAWEMATKVAESHALRRAFDVAAPTEDEATAEIVEAESRRNAVILETLSAKTMQGPAPGVERIEGEQVPSAFETFVEADTAAAVEDGYPEPSEEALTELLADISAAISYEGLREIHSDARAQHAADKITERGLELVRVALNARREEISATV